MNNQRGFSLVELVLITTLIPIMMGVYLSSINVATQRVDQAARKVEADLRYCQHLAEAEEVNCGLQTTNFQVYQIYRQNPGNLIRDPHTQQPMTVNLATFYAGVNFGANYQIEFNSQGRPVIGGGTLMRLTDGRTTRQVTVLANTGYVQVQ